MRRLHSLFLALALATALEAAAPEDLKIDISQGANPWSSLKINNEPGRFQFAVVTDRTGGHRGHVFQDGITKLNLLQPDFVMSVGDLIEGYTTDLAEIDAEWKEFTRYIQKLTVPFFYVPGNHDTANPVELAEYRKRFGRDYYHFVYRDVLFVCLSSDDPFPAKISDAQIASVAKALAENTKVRWTLLFMHRPLWVPQETEGKKNANKPTGFEKVEALLKGRPYTVFAGHNHHYKKHVRFDQRYFVLATTGAGSEMRGPAFGEFDHVAWVTMTEAGPLVANVMLDGVWDENVVTEKSSGFMERLNKAVPMQVSSLFSSSQTITGASVRLRCTNNADLPLKVRLNFADNSALKPSPLLQDAVVKPNSVRFFDLPLKAVGELKVADLGPVTYDWELSYDTADQPPLRIAGTSRLYIDGPLDLPRRSQPVLADGKLDEWPSLPIPCDSSRPPQPAHDQWTGPQDCSFKFAVEHDDKNFYVAVKVTDDVWLRKSADDAYNQDGVWVSLDPQPENKEKHASFWMMLLPGKTIKDSVISTADGVTGACLKTKEGYSAEAVIPFAGMVGRIGKEVKVNVTAYDFDPSESQDQGIYFNWRPSGDSGLDYPGSGTFIVK